MTKQWRQLTIEVAGSFLIAGVVFGVATAVQDGPTGDRVPTAPAPTVDPADQVKQKDRGAGSRTSRT